MELKDFFEMVEFKMAMKPVILNGYIKKLILNIAQTEKILFSHYLHQNYY